MTDTGYGVDVVIVDANIVGGLSEVKSRLQTIIATADSKLLPASDHILFNWRSPIISTENVPIITMRIGTAQYTDVVYGRKVSKSEYGKYIIYPFSLHVWNEKLSYEMQEGVDESKPTTDLADKIINKLERYTGDLTSGIKYFYNITLRESQPERGPQNLNRVIVEGFILVKRIL